MSDKSIGQSRPSGRSVVIAALMVIAISFALIGLWISRLDEEIARKAGPNEGYYWTVAQYELAYLRLREALEVVALHGEMRDEELSKRSDVLMSKALILIGESELATLFEGIAGFADGRRAIDSFHRRVDPALDAPSFMRIHASELVQEFASIENTILTLANAVRQEEMIARDIAVESLLTRRRLLWIAVWFGFGLMLLWVLSVSVSWSRYRREAAERERALESERQAVRAKTRFLGMVSHELRSPLQSIIAAVDVLERRRALPEQAEVTRRIRRAADELAVQLGDLLTLARGQTGRIQLRPEVFEAVELVREATENAAAAAEAKGLHLRLDIPSDPVFVVADGARVSQLLDNLAGNAVRHTKRGGVTITLQPFDARAAMLNLRIEDTGPGLPGAAAATLKHGIDPLLYTPGKGRGIGLAVVRALLLQLGGSVEVAAIQGSGTTIDLAIPAVAAEDRAPSAVSGNGRVLCVSDRRAVLEQVARVCRQLGLVCDEAGDAAVASNRLAAHAYAAVLVDMDTPSMSGVELAAQLRASALNGGTRLLALTSSRRPNEASSAFDALLKIPIRRESLVAFMASRTRQPAPPR
ncbi:hybrid sensor histidine kinase/response regulator [Variovorax sp. KK3]|uniref:hybrid sensor histidine kinase/response regulator n=1 Tax=Variovorax sp. KK3 TaxID=1855728 RepID=UPI0015C3C928|nr:hybrid sensor histidine kinase/response regulator [Variovorax sp. KK3]